MALIGIIIGGLIVQWGYSNRSGTTTDISFPTSFTSAPQVVCSGIWQSNSYAVSPISITTTTFKGWVQSTVSGFTWIAIGY